MAGNPFDMSKMFEALSGGGMGGMGGGMPGMPDMAELQRLMGDPAMQQQMMEAMQNDPTIKAFQQIAEEFAKDPDFVEMTQALQTKMGSGGGQPDMASYQEAMRSVFTNEKYMKKAEELGKMILSSNPDMSNAMQQFMQQTYNPEAAAHMEQAMKGIKEDPEFKPFVDLMEAGKVAEGMAFLQGKPDLMQKYNAALNSAFEELMSKSLPAGAGAGAAGAEEEEDLVDLHTAASEGEPELVKELLAAGAGVDEQDEEGRTPLHFAVGYGELECATLLLEAGANVNAVDNNLNTPLHYAAGYGQAESVKLLLKHKAQLGAENKDGNTALQVATLNEHQAVVEALEKAAPPKGLGGSLAPSLKKK